MWIAENGYTPLHEAAASGNISAVQALVVGGAKVNAKNVDGKTPIESLLNGTPSMRKEIADFLISHRATEGAPKQLPYFFELEKNPVYKQSVLKLFYGRTDIPEWLTRHHYFDGTGSFGRMVSINGENFEYYNICQTHNCSTDNSLFVLFTPGGKSAWAYATGCCINGESIGYFYGNPDASKKDFLIKEAHR